MKNIKNFNHLLVYLRSRDNNNVSYLSKNNKQTRKPDEIIKSFYYTNQLDNLILYYNQTKPTIETLQYYIQALLIKKETGKALFYCNNFNRLYSSTSTILDTNIGIGNSSIGNNATIKSSIKSIDSIKGSIKSSDSIKSSIKSSIEGSIKSSDKSNDTIKSIDSIKSSDEKKYSRDKSEYKHNSGQLPIIFYEKILLRSLELNHIKISKRIYNLINLKTPLKQLLFTKLSFHRDNIDDLYNELLIENGLNDNWIQPALLDYKLQFGFEEWYPIWKRMHEIGIKPWISTLDKMIKQVQEMEDFDTKMESISVFEEYNYSIV